MHQLWYRTAHLESAEQRRKHRPRQDARLALSACSWRHVPVAEVVAPGVCRVLGPVIPTDLRQQQRHPVLSERHWDGAGAITGDRLRLFSRMMLAINSAAMLAE